MEKKESFLERQLKKFKEIPIKELEGINRSYSSGGGWNPTKKTTKKAYVGKKDKLTFIITKTKKTESGPFGIIGEEELNKEKILSEEYTLKIYEDNDLINSFIDNKKIKKIYEEIKNGKIRTKTQRLKYKI